MLNIKANGWDLVQSINLYVEGGGGAIGAGSTPSTSEAAPTESKGKEPTKTTHEEIIPNTALDEELARFVVALQILSSSI